MVLLSKQTKKIKLTNFLQLGTVVFRKRGNYALLFSDVTE